MNLSVFGKLAESGFGGGVGGSSRRSVQVTDEFNSVMNSKAVKPRMPFSNDPQRAVYEPFIDYGTGKIKEGSRYFKPLSRTIMQYVEHPEHKFDGDVGVLERKCIHSDGVVYIGKEANNIDEQELDVKQAQVFVNEEELDP